MLTLCSNEGGYGSLCSKRKNLKKHQNMKFGQLNYLFDLLNDGCTAFLLVQSLLMKMKEEIEKAGLKLNTQKQNS